MNSDTNFFILLLMRKISLSGNLNRFFRGRTDVFFFFFRFFTAVSEVVTPSETHPTVPGLGNLTGVIGFAVTDHMHSASEFHDYRHRTADIDIESRSAADFPVKRSVKQEFRLFVFIE